MKLCAVYKSRRKVDTYLYVAERDNFEDVPEFLLKQFGEPIFVMMVALEKREMVAGVEKQKVLEKLHQQGFYLQMPPKTKSMLKPHQQQASTKKDA